MSGDPIQPGGARTDGPGSASMPPSPGAPTSVVDSESPVPLALAPLAVVGATARESARYAGSTLIQITLVTRLSGEVARWSWRVIASLLAWAIPGIGTGRRARLRISEITAQGVRFGLKSTFIVSTVSGSVGLILVLQMAPPLEEFGRKDAVANILGIAILRELGPLIAAIVLTGYAGAAIAAELGTMVVGEEIEALEAHALNPISFLVIPRVVATTMSMLCLAVISDVMAISAGSVIAYVQLDIPFSTFYANVTDQAKLLDFFTGLAKGGVFGLLIGLIACTNGLRVTGGAEGVGKATTQTVVQSVVAIVIADLIFTYLFFALKLF